MNIRVVDRDLKIFGVNVLCPSSHPVAHARVVSEEADNTRLGLNAFLQAHPNLLSAHVDQMWPRIISRPHFHKISPSHMAPADLALPRKNGAYRGHVSS
jgi:hypothetical protein